MTARDWILMPLIAAGVAVLLWPLGWQAFIALGIAVVWWATLGALLLRVLP